MINALFRSKLESNLFYIILFLCLNSFIGFILYQILNERNAPPNADNYVGIVIWLLIIGVLTGGGALMRHNREKRTRLYAQLPVTPLQIRLAYWGLAGLFMFISTAFFILIAINVGFKSDITLWASALLYFVHAGTLLGVASIIFNNSIRLIPSEIRKNTILYFFMAALLTFLTLFSLGFLVALYTRLMDHGVVNRTVLTSWLTVVFAGLVALDVYLYRNKDTYLG